MSNRTFDYGEIRVTVTSAYDWVWSDTGSGAARDVTLWNPRAQGNLKPLGSVGISNYNDLNGKRGSLLIGLVPGVNPPGGKPALVSPTGYTQIWTDRKSGGKHDGSFWRPTAPSGYVSCGDVCANGHSAPSTNLIWCVRADLVRDGTLRASSYWDDKKSGASSDVSCWDIVPQSVGVNGAEKLPILADAFRAHNRYDRPDTGNAYVPALKVERNYHPFNANLPKVTPNSIPSRGDDFDHMEQCQVTLPYVAFLPPTDSLCLNNIRDPFITLKKSIGWFVEGVWVNDAGGAFKRSQSIKYGVSKTQSQEMTHSVGVEVSASAGIGIVETSVSLNYQFTQTSSSSFTEFTEKEVTEEFEVPPYHATVLFSKHIWIRGERADGSHVMVQIEIAANDDVHFSGCNLI